MSRLVDESSCQSTIQFFRSSEIRLFRVLAFQLIRSVPAKISWNMALLNSKVSEVNRLEYVQLIWRFRNIDLNVKEICCVGDV